MIKVWDDVAWEDYVEWQSQDKKHIRIAQCKTHYGDK